MRDSLATVRTVYFYPCGNGTSQSQAPCKLKMRQNVSWDQNISLQKMT